MPNWVYNSVTISGTTKQVEAFYDKATAVSPKNLYWVNSKVG